jgi:HSP20 family protein
MNLRSLIPVGRERSAARPETYPFVSLQREIDRLFEDFTRGFPSFRTAFGSTELMPSVDVVETEKEIVITAELPGLEEKDVQINVADNVLTIRGEKKAEKEQKGQDYRMVERSYGAFSRSFELPEGTDLDAVQADMAKGVLKVTVPKQAPAVARKIEVKAAA